MTLHLSREDATHERTTGHLSVAGVWAAWTLEPALARFAPAEEHPAIPAGTYPVVIDRSERFSEAASIKAGYPVDVLLPHVLNVPGRDGIRFHALNTALETKGCIGVGQFRDEATIWGSAKALADLMHRLSAATDPITLTVDDPVPTSGVRPDFPRLT